MVYLKKVFFILDKQTEAPALPGKSLMYFLYIKVFSPMICFGFGVWGTLGSRGRVGVLRPFSELVGRPVQNLVEIGLAVHA